MWITTMMLAEVALCLPVTLPIDDAKAKSGEDASYVKVEIKGILETKGKPEVNWDSILKGASTGVRVLAPGKLDAGRRECPPDDWPAPPGFAKGDLGLSWELFLGEDKELQKLAKALKGKPVVARGNLTVNTYSLGWRFPRTIRYIVRVSSIEEAKPRIVQPRESIPAPDQNPDCIFMPSPPKVVEAMLKLADVQPGEVLFDLGSGDGRICIAAAKEYRARAYGYEIQARLVKESLENVKKNKVQEQVTIERRDIFKLDLSGADVVTLWLLPAMNVKLIPQLEKMKPGSRIVSFDFDMMNIVKPDKVIELEVKPDQWNKDPTRRVYLWKTPLKKDEKLFREWYPRCAGVLK
jgi:hypothetical protein